MQENIIPVTIEDKMRDAYLNYSLSVIVARALPDVRDGLKPVHRRILYAASELGLDHNKPHKKSARIVGEVLGKYHPHGDAAVYDAMVRMAQDFNLRYQLIDGHGNFGSIDGDSPAAMRYTEARLTKLAEEILSDIKEETVDFVDNFDGSLQEPVILPTNIPNLLINGVSGIAVGMSTDIPPHNLTEVINALIYLLKNPNARLSTIMNYITGPDFPTGGQIVGKEGINAAYNSGKGKIILRAKTKVEKIKRKEQIIISEIPYQINKARLIEEIATMITKGKIKNISDLRDESDQDGLRIVIELKTGADSDLILNQLYKYTNLQSSYRINMLALVDNRPEVMDLITILQHFIDFRREIITRRVKFKLDKAQKRYHILQGLLKAIDKLDLIISIIRNSKSTKEAQANLEEKLAITPEQADAILKMQLQRLVGMETEKLQIEAEELKETINEYQKILKDKEQLDNVLKEELKKIKKNYSDQRKTEIIEDEKEALITKSDLIKEQDAVITFSYRQNIKRTNSKDYARAGKNDYITQVVSGTTLDNLLFFTASGEVYTLAVHQIPEHHGLSTGENIKKYLNIPLKEKIIRVLCLNEEIQEKYITMITKQGLVKKTKGNEYKTSYTNIKAIKLNPGDEVIDVIITDGTKELFLATKERQTIRFKEDTISDTGRNTQGNIGIKLIKNDYVINAGLSQDDDYIVSISNSAKGKRTPIKEYKLQQRNGKGLRTCGSKIYKMAAVINCQLEDYLLIETKEQNNMLISVADITKTTRAGNMYQLFELRDDNQITAVYKLPLGLEENEEEE